MFPEGSELITELYEARLLERRWKHFGKILVFVFFTGHRVITDELL
jgi:hypothetical protein